MGRERKTERRDIRGKSRTRQKKICIIELQKKCV